MDEENTIEGTLPWREWLKEFGWELATILVLIVILTIVFLSMAQNAIGNVFSQMEIG